jgi:hypothetical protein
MAAQVTPVLDIVVHKGEVVQQLDGGGNGGGSPRIGIQRRGDQHGEPGTNAFSRIGTLASYRRQIRIAPAHVVRGDLLEQDRSSADFGDRATHDRLEERVECRGV